MVVIAEGRVRGVERMIRLVVSQPEVARTEQARHGRRDNQDPERASERHSASLLPRLRTETCPKTESPPGNPCRATCPHPPWWSTIITINRLSVNSDRYQAISNRARGHDRPSRDRR